VFDTLRHRDFALLWSAGLISTAGDFALVIALMVHVYRLTDSTLATAGLFAASYVPRIIVGSIAGVFVDRWDRKRTMIWADLSRAFVLLLLLFASGHDRLWIVFTVSAVMGAIGQFFNPAESALLPKLVGEERLVAANSLNSLNDELGRLAGPAMGAWLYAVFGLGGVAVADAATFVASAILIKRIAAEARPLIDSSVHIAGSSLRRAVGEWSSGMRLVRGSRTLKVLFAVGAISWVSEGFFVTLGLAPLVLDVLKGSEVQVGWIASAQAVGGLIAGLVVARAGHRFSKRWLLGGGRIGLGVADLLMFNARSFVGPGNPAVGVAMGSMFIAGFPAVAGGVGGQSLLQTETADAYRGRVFGALNAIQSVALLFGLAFAGVFGKQLGIALVLSIGSGMGIIAGIVALVLLPKDERLAVSVAKNAEPA
jgi:MFS family permease